MPSSPLDPSHVEEANDHESAFRRGLVKIDQLIDSGVGLSGHERNCGFLNVPAGGGERRFATASAALGLDHDDDSRTPVLVDWDRDGDLDLWVANRSAPMLRFLRNDMPRDQNWLALRLEGKTCNRDAVGAKVTVTIGHGAKLSRTLKAGEGYLGQSSKWLHFGLGAGGGARAVMIEVRWPGGERERFPGVEPGSRYRLIQGGEVMKDTVAPPLPSGDRDVREAVSPSAPEESLVCAITPSRWPLPQLPYTTFSGDQRHAGGSSGRYLLVNLWATWCLPCLAELKTFGDEYDRLKRSDVELLALSVDKLAMGGAGENAAQERPETYFAKLDLPFRGGHATEVLVQRVESAYARLFGIRWPLPVPTSVLLDPEGCVLAFYKGSVPAARVLADIDASKGEAEAFHDQALPLEGRWFKRPQPLDPLVIALDLMEAGEVDAALELAGRAEERLRKSSEYAQLLTWIGDELMKRQRASEALTWYRKAVREDDENTIVLNNLAWQLAAHEDLKMRDGKEAVRWAERAAALTEGEDPAVLDTLAAAYAQDGQFEKAVTTAGKALVLARSQNKRALWEGIQRGLRYYRAGRPYGVK